jgi:hypothetical protein
VLSISLAKHLVVTVLRPLATEDFWSDIVNSISAPLFQVMEVFYGCMVIVPKSDTVPISDSRILGT